MNRYRFVRLTIAVLVSATLMVADLHLQAFDSLRGGMSLVLTPFRDTAQIPWQVAAAVSDYFGARTRLLEEKRQLHERLLRQSVRISSLDFFVAQNDELRSMLSLQQRLAGDWIAADVRQETAQVQEDRIYLNRGVADGVLPGMTVVDEQGIVGQIVRADAKSSVVNLLANPGQWVAARVRRTGQLAIVRGAGGGEMQIYSMPDNADLTAGDELIADGGIFPAGYPVGTVTEVLHGVRYLSALVEPASDFYGPRTLLIYIKQLPQAEVQ